MLALLLSYLAAKLKLPLLVMLRGGYLEFREGLLAIYYYYWLAEMSRLLDLCEGGSIYYAFSLFPGDTD